MRRGDLPAVGRVLARAFAQDPFYVSLFPALDARARILPPYFEVSAAAAMDVDAAYVIPAHDRPVGGAALWAPPISPEDRSASSPMPAGGLRHLFGAEAFASYATVMEHLHGRRMERVATPHLYLNLVGVHPSAHGRGLGRALLEPGLLRADRERVPTVLETFERANLAVYARFGFEPVVRDEEPRTGLVWWLLVRSPRNADPRAREAHVAPGSQTSEIASRNASSNAPASEEA